jgi:hypothetical protein
MIKTKSKNIIILLVLALLTLSTTSFAAVYDWIGVFDSDWDNPDNWNVTGSIWTWPNEQYFNIAKECVNDDCEEINIASGNKLSRLYGLTMSGASEGSNETILTISNNTDLYIWGCMWIGQCGTGTVKTEVSNGSSLFVDSLVVGDAEGSTGLLDVVNGAVEVVGEMYVGKYDNSTGKLQIRRDVPSYGYDLRVWKNMTVGSFNDSMGTVDIDNSSIKLENRLLIGLESTGIFKIGGSTLSIRGNMEAGSGANSSGTVEIKSSTVDIGDDLKVGRKSTGMFEIEDSILDIGGNMTAGNKVNSSGTIKIKSSTVGIGGTLKVGRESTGMCAIEDSILNIGETLFVGEESTGMCEIEDSTLDIYWNLVVGKSSGSTGTIEIKDSTLDIKGRLRLTRGGTSGTMSIEGNSKISVNEEFRMGDKDTLNAVSKLEMDGGDVVIGSHCHLNMDGGAGSVADFTLNDGRWTNDGNIYVGETPRGDCSLTINGGTMVSYSNIFVGSPGIDDFGQSRIFLNGGLLQGEGLECNIKANSRIVYKGGELWINKSALTEAEMQDLINIGKIDVPVNYEITTIGDYTVLRGGYDE